MMAVISARPVATSRLEPPAWTQCSLNRRVGVATARFRVVLAGGYWGAAAGRLLVADLGMPAVGIGNR